MNDEPRLVLLDTHVWLWYASGSEKAISPKLKALLAKLAPTSGIRVSSISLWEIGLLVAKDRIALMPNAKEWVYEALIRTDTVVEDMSAEVAIESTLFGPDLHGDPADRFLIATAKHIGATLITHDKEILAYCKKHDFRALSL